MMVRKRSRKAKTVKQPAMRITRQRREVIAQLADALAELAPATTPGKGFCVQRVAEDHGLKKCWTRGGNKRQMIARFLEKVFRQHPRKPKAVVMAIVRGGLDWRAYDCGEKAGDPVRGETPRDDVEGVGALATVAPEHAADVRID